MTFMYNFYSVGRFLAELLKLRSNHAINQKMFNDW